MNSRDEAVKSSQVKWVYIFIYCIYSTVTVNPTLLEIVWKLHTVLFQLASNLVILKNLKYSTIE